MKIKNNSSRVYCLSGMTISPGETAEVDSKWKKVKSFAAALESGELTEDKTPDKADKSEQAEVSGNSIA